MATRDLSKSVNEGGRVNYAKHLRKQAHRTVRQSMRLWLHACKYDDELFDEGEPSFNIDTWDINSSRIRLNCAYRWLHSQVGKSWSDVHLEMLSRFKSKTHMGNYIINQYLIPLINISTLLLKTPNFYRCDRNEYWVDEYGVLRFEKFVWKYSRTREEGKHTHSDVVAWLGGYMVIKRGNGELFWAIPVTINHPIDKSLFYYHRQGWKFTPEEKEFWSNVYTYQQEQNIYQINTAPWKKQSKHKKQLGFR